MIEKLQSTDNAISYLQRKVYEANEIEEKKELYKGLAILFDHNEDYLNKALYLDCVLQLEPENRKIRFDTAYAYLNCGFIQMAIFHFNLLSTINPDDDKVLNNLGVAFDRIGLLFSSIDEFKKSSDLGNSLASANLSFSYIENGFENEAKKILDKALQADDVSPNIGKAISELDNRKENEKERKKEILKSSSCLQSFLREYLSAKIRKPECEEGFLGSFKTRDGLIIHIENEEEEVFLTWDDTHNQMRIEIANRSCALVSSEIAYYQSGEGGYQRDTYEKLLGYLSEDCKTLFLAFIDADKCELLQLTKLG